MWKLLVAFQILKPSSVLQDLIAFLTRCSYGVNLHTWFQLFPLMVFSIFGLALFTELPTCFFTTGHSTGKFLDSSQTCSSCMFILVNRYCLLKLETYVISISSHLFTGHFHLSLIWFHLYSMALLSFLPLAWFSPVLFISRVTTVY